MGVAEALYEAIEQSFRETGHPRDLIIVHAAGQSNRKIGFEHFAVEGLAKRIVGSHWGLMPRMSAFLGQGGAEAVCQIGRASCRERVKVSVGAVDVEGKL